MIDDLPAHFMIFFTIAIGVVLGLAFGSFLNVCIHRLPLKESIVAPRSRCPQCLIPIRSFDNIPVLSWIILRGRCRACRAAISVRYPLVELATAALFTLAFLHFGLSVYGVAAAVFCFLLLGLAVMDAETFLLPDAFTLTGIGLGIALRAADAHAGLLGTPWLPTLVGRAGAAILDAAIAAAAILVIRWIYWLIRRREGLGLGDARLLAMIAAWLGWERTLLVFFLAVVGGAFFAMGMLLKARLNRAKNHEKTTGFNPHDSAEKAAQMRLPLGTFLSIAAIYTMFFGWQTINWYLSFFP